VAGLSRVRQPGLRSGPKGKVAAGQGRRRLFVFAGLSVRLPDSGESGHDKSSSPSRLCKLSYDRSPRSISLTVAKNPPNAANVESSAERRCSLSG